MDVEQAHHIGFNKEQLELDRKIALESMVVKILKSRKSIAHSDLVKELEKMTTVLQFMPSQQFIKSVISNLIERDYIARNAQNTTQYEYVG